MGELVVGQLESLNFPDLAIDSAAVRAVLDLSTLLIDFLVNLSAPQVVEERTSKLPQELPTFGLGEQNSRTVLKSSR
jgi:hypothetical protein